MLLRCHPRIRSPKPRALVALVCSPALLSPLLNFLSSFLPLCFSFRTQAFRGTAKFGSTGRGKLFDPRHAALFSPTLQYAMDSMPIQTVPVPSQDALKISEPETKIQHVEHINAPATVEHHEHLPKGISETDEERKAHWFIGSIDCGTTSSRFLIFNGEGTPVASHQIEFENIYPESG